MDGWMELHIRVVRKATWAGLLLSVSIVSLHLHITAQYLAHKGKNNDMST